MTDQILNQRFLYILPSEITQSEDGVASLGWADNKPHFFREEEIVINPTIHTMQLRMGVFTPEECKKIIELGESADRIKADTEDGLINYRVGRMSWIEPDPEVHWLYHKLGMVFLLANQSYKFHLRGFVDALQYTLYGSGEFFAWHIDMGPGITGGRKLSMTIQLSSPDEYEGGHLEFTGASDLPASREQGAVTIFPSYLAHRVTPVTRGVRRSLVVWAYGPRFL